MGKGKKINLELLQYINPDTDDSLISEINDLIINRVAPLITLINEEVTDVNYSFKGMSEENKTRLTRSIIFLGKLYTFSKHFNLSPFFHPHIIRTSQTIREDNFDNEYLQFLARTAVKANYQKQYFNLFDEYYNQEKSKYLWGYGRILLWYYSFDQEDYRMISYRDNFIKLSKYLLSKKPNRFDNQYLQNAFLSLIYILTFSEKDTHFFQDNSKEKQIAEQVVEKYKNQKIILKQVSTKQSLNEILSDLITGNATQEEVSRLIELA